MISNETSPPISPASPRAKGEWNCPIHRLSSDELLKQLSDTDLMTTLEVSRWLEDHPDPRLLADAKSLAAQLIEEGKITHYQASVLLQGQTEKLLIDKYLILDSLDAGGMGVVFKAIHRPMNRVVALKMLSPHLLNSPDKVQRFRREVQVAASLTHPNIVTAHDADESKGLHFLVMEYVQGRDLKKIVDSNGPLTVDEAVDYVLQAARGLAHAHKKGVVHRDVKPSNLMLSTDGELKVLDLGLARLDEGLQLVEKEISTHLTTHEFQDAPDDHLTSAGTLMGTVAFMAPEQAIDTHNVDYRADIYSLGCTLYYLLVGEAPYRGNNPMQTVIGHREAPIPSLRRFRPDVPEELDAIGRRMLAKSPNDRPQSMAEVIAALQALECVAVPSRRQSPTAAAVRDSADGDTDLTTILDPSELQEGNLRSRWAMAVAAIAICLLVAGVVWNPFRQTPDRDDDQTIAARVSVEDESEGWQGWPVDAPPPAIAPFDAEEARQHQKAWAEYLRVPVDYTNSIGMKFCLIPPGEFMMGTTPEEIEGLLSLALNRTEEARFLLESPRHSVVISRPFYLAQYEVTQRHFVEVMSFNPSHFSATGEGAASIAGHDTSEHPVESLDWWEAVGFCAKLGDQEELSLPYEIEDNAETAHVDSILNSNGYRLPTEAEWEYSCRAGTETEFFFGDDPDELPSFAWCSSNAEEITHPVGQWLPNPFGLYDVLGNVDEQCGDYLREYTSGRAVDPRGENPAQQRSVRGSHYSNRSVLFRSSYRIRTTADGRARYQYVGFRPALSIQAVRQNLSQSNFALHFDGVHDYVEIPNLATDTNQPFTIEAWVTPSELDNGTVIYQSIGGKLVLSEVDRPLKWRFHFMDRNLRGAIVSDEQAEADTTVHVAVTFDRDNLRVFVNGRIAADDKGVFISHRDEWNDEHVTKIGMGEVSSWFGGLIDEVRMSNTTRYTEDFTPAERFEPDEHTLALYHFDEGHGDVLIDSSGNNHDGQIHGATWVRVDSPPAASDPEQPFDWTDFWPEDAPPPAIAPFDAEQAVAHQQAWADYLGVPVEYENSIGMKFRLISPGEFLMGSTPEEIDAALLVAGEDQAWRGFIQSEGPQHEVVLTQPIFLGVTEVTQSLYEQVVGTNPSHFAAPVKGRNPSPIWIRRTILWKT